MRSPKAVFSHDRFRAKLMHPRQVVWIVQKCLTVERRFIHARGHPSHAFLQHISKPHPPVGRAPLYYFLNCSCRKPDPTSWLPVFLDFEFDETSDDEFSYLF